MNPQHSYQGAGLLLYGDSNNYVRLERGFGDMGAIAFEYAKDGTHTKLNGPFAIDPRPVPTSANVVRLRLERDDGSVKAAWRAAEAPDWAELTNIAHIAGDVKAGVAVLNRSQPSLPDPARKPLAATFSYVRIVC